MGRNGYDITQATIITSISLTDTLGWVQGGALYRITGTTLQTLINGSQSPTESVLTKTAGYTVVSGNNIINADTDTAGGVIAIVMSQSTDFWDSTLNRSQVITVNNIGATDNTTVTPAGSETIQGSASITIAAGASAQIYTDGSNLFTRAL